MALTISNGITEIAKRFVPPPRFIPQFQDPQIRPPYKPDQTPNDGSYFVMGNRRFFATRETADWVNKEFGGLGVIEKPALLNGYHVNVPQYWIDFGSGEHGLEMHMNAGDMAWKFTVRPDPASDDTEGYWMYGSADVDVMRDGRTHVLREIDQTRRER